MIFAVGDEYLFWLWHEVIYGVKELSTTNPNQYPLAMPLMEKSCTSWYVKYPIVYEFIHPRWLARFLPSTGAMEITVSFPMHDIHLEMVDVPANSVRLMVVFVVFPSYNNNNNNNNSNNSNNNSNNKQHQQTTNNKQHQNQQQQQPTLLISGASDTSVPPSFASKLRFQAGGGPTGKGIATPRSPWTCGV